MFFIFVALPQKLFMPANYLRPWQLILDLVFNWWPVVFIPMGLALYAALMELKEKKAGNYRSLRVRDISPAHIWIAKVVIMGCHTLISTLVLIGATVISGLITGDGSIPWLKIFAGGFATWIVSLAIIPLQLWIATWKGTFASIAMGFIGLIAGVVAAAGILGICTMELAYKANESNYRGPSEWDTVGSNKPVTECFGNTKRHNNRNCILDNPYFYNCSMV